MTDRRGLVCFLIPAHNEAGSIAETVRRLVGLAGPVFVVADHCSDATAQLAAEAGARVYERRDGPAGKGAALSWFAEAARDELSGVDLIVVLDADLAKSTQTEKFKQRFPDRFVDCGVAEQNLMATAAGLAATGKIVFASTFAVFATGRAFDQVRNTIAYSNLNVKICASHGGITVGEDGSSHQALEDITLMRAIPRMRVVVPADYYETREAVKAVAYLDGPAYVRIGRPKVPVLFDEGYSFEFEKAPVMRPGKDVTLIACGFMLHQALDAADPTPRGDSPGDEALLRRWARERLAEPAGKRRLEYLLARLEAVLVREALAMAGGNRSRAARLLGVSRPTLHARIEKYGLRLDVSVTEASAAPARADPVGWIVPGPGG